MKPIRTMKNITLKAIPLVIALLMAAPSAFAAKYYLSDNTNLVKGCSGTIEIKIDTEGANVIAGDSTILINKSEVSVNQLSIGTSMPMQVFNQISDTNIKLSGARLPMSGSFNGVGTLGYINFTPNENAASGTFTFAPDLNLDNNLIDENINNVLKTVVSKTYTFKDPYNSQQGGDGFCTPDTTPPTVQFVYPPTSSSNIPVDSNVFFTLSDNRAGVDINTLKFSVDGIKYDNRSGQVTVQQDAGLYRIEMNPAADFKQGANIIMSVNICDLNLPANCTTGNSNFRIFTPTPPPPVCGDGIANYQNGEQCDDGNKVTGDGCNSLCLYEVPVAQVLGNATCTDGLMNQGEGGIDCGGPCAKTCPSCVDGFLNQGEMSVDCGGPCPPCGEKPTVTTAQCPVTTEEKLITICHYPEGQPTNPHTMEIPESAWPTHQAHSDTLGECPVYDLCSQALLLAAPEREKQALTDAANVIEQKGFVEQQKTAVEAPKVITEVKSQIDICKANPAYVTANFDSTSADSDGDGMSDRMECYAETNPLKADTDGDGCSDYEELNNYFSNPNDPADCKVQTAIETFSDALVTDPQPGWILSTKTPAISGKVPAGTVLVLVIATQSEQAQINSLLKAVDPVLKLTATSVTSEKDDALAQFKDKLDKAKEFIVAFGKEFNSEKLASLVASLPADLTADNITSVDVKASLESLKADLLLLEAKPIVATASTQLQETTVGEFDAKNFEETSNPLQDKQTYDLVATAYLADGTQVSSKAVRFSIDLANTINKPVPRTIGGKLIPTEVAFNDLFIGGKAYAQDGSGKIEVQIEQDRPTITGETEFGSQVFAIWNSVVLASSVISDSEEGAFEVQAPRNMEVDAPHRVTLYAVKTEDNNKIRSESVDVFFRIKGPGGGMRPIVLAVSGSLFLMVLVYVIRRIILRRSTMKLFRKR